MLLTIAAVLVLAQPRLGPPVEVEPPTATEPLNFYSFGSDVVFNGSGYALAWVDDRSSFAALYGAIISLDGGVVVPGVRQLITPKDFQYVGGVSACRRGNELYFSVTSEGDTTHLLITRADLQRRALLQWPIRTNSRTALGCDSPTPLWAMTELFYAGTPHFALHVYGLDDAGVPFVINGGNPFISELDVNDTPGVGPVLAYGASRSLLVWASGGADGGVNGHDLHGAFIDGQLINPPFTIASGPADQREPAVAWDPTNAAFVVTWVEGTFPNRDLWHVQIAAGGAMTVPATLASTPEDETSPVSTFDGTSVWTAWLSGTPKPEAIWLEQNQSTGGPREMITAYVDDLHLVSDGTGAQFLGWRDFGRGIRNVGQFVRAGDAGVVIDPARTLRAQIRPALINGSAGPIVTWTESGDRYARLLDGDAGTVLLGPGYGDLTLGASPTQLAMSQRDTIVTVELRDPLTLARRSTPITLPLGNPRRTSVPVWNGESFVFASIDSDGGQLDLVVDELLVDGGRGLHLITAPSQNAAAEVAIAFASNARTHALVWNEEYRVYAQCVTSLRAPSPVRSAVITVGDSHYEPRPRIAASADGFLVTWVGERQASPYQDLAMAQRLDGQCQLVGPPIEIAEVVEPWNSWPEVAFDGLRYGITWSSSSDVLGDVHATFISQSGVVSPELVIAASGESDVEPAITALQSGRWLAAWTRFFGDESRSARRVIVRSIESNEPGSTCTARTQCASGQCVDGVCCASACNSASDSCETCAVTGVCRAKPSGVVCRASGASCDQAETCDGLAPTCPMDTSGTTCTLCSDMPLTFDVSCGVNFSLPSSAIPIPDGGVPITWALRSCTADALPGGLNIDANTGAVSWAPDQSARVLIIAQGPTSSAVQTVQLDYTCVVLPDGGVVDAGVMDAGVMVDAGVTEPEPTRRTLGIGCGCSSGSALIWLCIVLMARRAR